MHPPGDGGGTKNKRQSGSRDCRVNFGFPYLQIDANEDIGASLAGLLARRNKKRAKNMSSEKNQNVQDVFLNYIRKNKTPVTVFLVNGVKLQGIVTWFDNFSVLLRRDGHTQLVYKHAISTIMPGGPISLFEPTGKDDEVIEEA